MSSITLTIIIYGFRDADNPCFFVAEGEDLSRLNNCISGLDQDGYSDDDRDIVASMPDDYTALESFPIETLHNHIECYGIETASVIVCSSLDEL